MYRWVHGGVERVSTNNLVEMRGWKSSWVDEAVFHRREHRISVIVSIVCKNGLTGRVGPQRAASKRTEA